MTRPELGAWTAWERARALALACRTDRRLQEASEAGSRPEIALAGALRDRLRAAVEARRPTAELFAVVSAVHEQLDFLPKPTLPTGLRVFFRELFGASWDDEVITASTARLAWLCRTGGPVDGRSGGGARGRAGDGPYPLTVIPQAELHNPLMWPLVAVQAAAYDGWTGAETVLQATLGTALQLAQAEALAAVDPDGARELWRRTEGVRRHGRVPAVRSEGPTASEGLAVASEGPAAEQLAVSLEDGVLISAYRRATLERSTIAGAGGQSAVYENLAAAYDEPAGVADILSAGWLHWHDRGVPRLLSLSKEAGGWHDMCRFVSGIDDLLCRSLDVAAVHRFYSSGGATP